MENLPVHVGACLATKIQDRSSNVSLLARSTCNSQLAKSNDWNSVSNRKLTSRNLMPNSFQPLSLSLIPNALSRKIRRKYSRCNTIDSYPKWQECVSPFLGQMYERSLCGRKRKLPMAVRLGQTGSRRNIDDSAGMAWSLLSALVEQR